MTHDTDPDAPARSLRIECRESEQPTLSVLLRTRPEAIGKELLSAFEELYAELEALGIRPLGRPFVAIHRFSRDCAEVEAGVPTQPCTAVCGRARARAISVGRYLRLSQAGDEATLRCLSVDIARWLADQSEHLIGPLYVQVVEKGSSAGGWTVQLDARIMASASAMNCGLGIDLRGLSSAVGALDAIRLDRLARQALALGAAQLCSRSIDGKPFKA